MPKPNQKISKIVVKNTDFLVKGVSAKGTRTTNRQVKKVVLMKETPSAAAGKK
jgi:hypothetical protein